MSENISFSINCIMKKRWIPHFLAMLNYMEQLGNLGGSRIVSLYSDGDGDFHPKFEWLGNEYVLSLKKEDLPNPKEDIYGDRTYDAG